MTSCASPAASCTTVSEPGDLPYTLATGEVLADITPRETMEAALAAIDYEDFRARQRSAREQGVYLGLGI